MVNCLPTTVQVAEKTLQMLNKLKKEIGAKSHDEVIRMLISERKKIPRSMFGSNPNLRPFSQKDEAEFHEL
jgi:predicted CopG family antitoxin